MGVVSVFRLNTGSALRWSFWESSALVLYAAVVAAGIRWHEGWTDEAQAWMIARDSSLLQMLVHVVRYEGSPGLWHSILWVLVRLHLSYIGMHYVAGLIATAGIAVFLRWAPFPRFLKLLTPFSFFLAYQDAVVARSYVLFAVLGFGAAAVLRQQKDRPITLAILLGLIANISAHGFVASGGLAIVAGIEAYRNGVRLDKRRSAALGLLLLFWIGAVATAFPTRTTDFAAAKNLQKSRVRVTDAQGVHWRYGNDEIPVDPNPDKPHIVTKAEASSSLTMKPGELAPIPFTRAHLPLSKRLWLHLARFLGLLTFPISTSRSLALIALVLFFALLYTSPKHRLGDERAGLGMLAVVPYALIILIFNKLYIAPRHAGMLFTVFLISLWLAWPTTPLQEDEPPRQIIRVALSTVLLLVMIQQAGWTKDSIITDMHDPYSGDWTTARFLKDVHDEGPIAGFYYHSIGALAYFPGFHYSNQPHDYWWWSTALRINQQAPKVLAQHPAYVVIGGFEWGNEGDVAVDWADSYEGSPFMPMADSYRIATYFEHHGYVESHRFCGRLLMRDGYSEQVCNIILEPYVPED